MSSKEQEDRTNRRKNALLLWERSIGCTVEMLLFENTVISGVLIGVDSKQNHFLLKDMKSPIGVYKSALIRQSDVISIDVLYPDTSV